MADSRVQSNESRNRSPKAAESAVKSAADWISAGSFVTVSGSRLGKVVSISGEKVEVEFFQSPRPSDRWTELLAGSEVRSISLPNGTRAFVRDSGGWHLVRLLANGDPSLVQMESDDQRFEVPIRNLFVQSRPGRLDPIEAVQAGLFDDPNLASRRTAFVDDLLAMRSAARGLDAYPSSRIALHPHQLEIVQRVLRDPIQRYLLADEVGLGKTIEAGVILRQFLLDESRSPAVILVPPLLVEQWRTEMTDKFGIKDFAGRVHILPWDKAAQIRGHVGMLIVDEAHHLVSGAFDEVPNGDYTTLSRLARDASRLLLLSATPLLHNEASFLAMLHLIDPDLYPLDELDAFRARVEAKRDFAFRFQAFQVGAKDFVIEEHAEAFRQMFPHDLELAANVETILDLIDRADTAGSRYEELLRRTRAHLGETYRLHRRVLRTRRDSPLATQFPVRGRRLGELPWIIDEPSSDIDAWVERWFDLLARRGRFAEASDDERVVVRGLLDRVQVCPLVVTDYVNSWLGQPVSGDAELTRREHAALRHWSLTPDERAHLLDLVSLCSRRETQSPWGVAVANRVLQLPPGCVVFCGYDRAARDVANALQSLRPSVGVSLLVSDGGSRTSVERDFDAFRSGRVQYLVCGAIAEEGRNIQFADGLLHVHVPLDPSRVEQRIGRVDRFGSGPPVPSHFSPTVPKVIREWVHLLRDGFQVLDGSIATLQHVLAGTIAEAWDRRIARGESAWLEYAPELQERLAIERREILQLENLESIEIGSRITDLQFSELRSIDGREEEIGGVFERWLCNQGRSGDGLGMTLRHDDRRGQVFWYDVSHATAQPERVEVLKRHLGEYIRTRALVTYRRELACRWPDVRLMRPGDPYCDAIGRLAEAEDVGRTYAFWRRAPFDAPTLVVRLSYRIAGDPTPALEWLKQHGLSGDATVLRRLIDGFVAPRTLGLLLDEEGREVSELIRERAEPDFNPRRDQALNSRLVRRLEDTFDLDWSAFWTRVRGEADRQVIEMADLHSLIDQARRGARQYFDDAKHQLDLRRQAEDDRRQSAALEGDVAHHEALGSAVVASIRQLAPQLETVGLMILGRDTPEEMWGAG